MAALNPMAAAFGSGSGAVAAAAAAAAAAVFAAGNNSSSGGNSAVTSGTSSSSVCDYTNMDKIEWMNRIENAQVDRSLMNKLVMNYLVTEGFKEAADKFGTETGIHYPYDTDSLNERIKIREAIELGQIEQAVCLINNLHPELIDHNRILAFHLQQQQLIEYIRDRRLEEALLFAQNHLCEYVENNDRVQEELERTMALLAFENPQESPFSDLLQTVQRHRLASEANSAILEFENQESNAKLNILIKMLLWSQDLLDKKGVNYPKMTDLSNARVEDVHQHHSMNSTQ